MIKIKAGTAPLIFKGIKGPRHEEIEMDKLFQSQLIRLNRSVNERTAPVEFIIHTNNYGIRFYVYIG